MSFSNREIADIHFIYGFCNGNASAAVREYRNRFPNRRIPTRRLFTQIHADLATNGISRNPRERGIDGASRTEDVLAAITRDPSLSVRRISAQLEISPTTVWNILKRAGLYPFHLTKVQHLHDPDYLARSNFCAWIISQVRFT